MFNTLYFAVVNLQVCLVTGGTGFVGRRVVELLVHRGAEKVISFDIVPKPPDAWEHPNITWVEEALFYPSHSSYPLL